jgi:cbb3-type cytochrome oxidase subunit 3
MQVTIIFEELKLFPTQRSFTAHKSPSKNLRFKVCRHHQLYALALSVSCVLFLFKLWTIGIVLFLVATLVFAVCSYFKQAFDLEIRFNEQDALEDAVKQDLFD